MICGDHHRHGAETSDETINDSLPTGHIEVRIEQFEVQSAADVPLQVSRMSIPARRRLRRISIFAARGRDNIMLRAQIIQSIRARMVPGLHRIPDADPDSLFAGRRA